MTLTPAARDAAVQASRLLADAQSLSITTTAEYNAAAALLPAVKGLASKLEAERFSQTRPLDQQKARVIELYRPLTDTLTKAEGIVKRGLAAFQAEQRRLQQEQQRIADEAARREREAAEKRATEAREKAEEQARLLREAALAEEDELVAAKLELQAARFEERAEMRAEKWEDRAAAVVAPVVPVDIPKAAGISSREVWKFAITDHASIPREYLIPDEKAIGGVVRALKGKTNIPGVRVFSEDTIASRSAS